MQRDALISECGLYRYRLSRTWGDERPACFIMLNPSTADATQDDPTIRRCIGFARAWGCGGIVVVNLFALRATDPRELYKHESPIGPENDSHIRAAVIECDPVVCAWGVCGTFRRRDEEVAALIRSSGLPWGKCLGVTRDGHPRHPLYVAGGTPLIDFRPAVEGA
jgi:hypothetical protein